MRPNVRNVSVRYGQLQNYEQRGPDDRSGARAIRERVRSRSFEVGAVERRGCRWRCRGPTSLDVAYAGQHSWDDPGGTNINAIDFGTAFLSGYLDRSSTATGVAASVASLNPDLARGYKGFSTINLQHHQGWRTFHSVQLSINRRFRNGFSFQLNDTISLYDHQSTPQRWQHDAQGFHVLRADQAAADELLGTRHLAGDSPHQGQLRVGDSANAEQPAVAARRRPRRKRLAGVRRGLGRHGHRLRGRLHVLERRQPREPDGFA